MNFQPRIFLFTIIALLLVLLSGCGSLHQTTQLVINDLPTSIPTIALGNQLLTAAVPTKTHEKKPTQILGMNGPKADQISSASTSTSSLSTSDFNVILGQPTANSISISLWSKSYTQVRIQYGTAPGTCLSQTNPINLKAAEPQVVRLMNLAPDTTYFYQVVGTINFPGEHTFHTQRNPGDTFTFTIDADPHYSDPNFNGQLFEISLKNALSDHPDFHIDLGDTFMTEKINPHSLNDDISAYMNMRSYFSILAADAPLFLVNGNHDGELGWLLSIHKNEPIWATQLRQLYFPSPSPNSFYSGANSPDPSLGTIRDAYYSWTWGDALFIILDPFWYSTSKPDPNDLNSNWRYTLGKAQYDWLKTTLESSSAKFKFVFIHNLVGGNDKDGRGGIESAPYFEWGGLNADGTYGFDSHRPGWGVPIHDILVQNHVSAVFHGHDHVFVKQELDGIIYQEVPQPDIARYDNTGLAAQYGYVQGDALSSSGYLRLTVSTEKITVDYIRCFLPKDENNDQQSGKVAYSYSIY